MNGKLFSVRAASCAVISAIALSSMDAFADLTKVPGLTEIQAPVAETIQDICPRLGALPDKTPEQTELFVACRKMVQTSNEQQGVGPNRESLGLSEEQLRVGIQAIGEEEVAAKQRGVSDTRSRENAIKGRMLALRAGARGLTVAQASLDDGKRKVDLAGLLPKGVRGGGASADDSRWGGFVNFYYNDGDRDTTTREDGFDFRNVGLTGGVDYRLTDNLALGGAITWESTKSDFYDNLGNVDADSFGLSLYGTWYSGNWFVDGQMSYAWTDFDTVRNIVIPSLTEVEGIDTRATGSTEADQFSGSIGGGFNLEFGSVRLAPYGRLDGLRMKIDGYTESEPVNSLGLDIDGRTVKSLQTALGARISTPISTGVGVFTPYGAVEWNHEYENNSASLVAKYTHDPFNQFFVIPTDDPDRNYFTWSAGAAGQFARGFSGFLNLTTVSGLKYTSYFGLTLGARMEF